VLILIGLPIARLQRRSLRAIEEVFGLDIGQAMPDGWKPLTFRRYQTYSYEVVKEGESVVVKARATRQPPV
jgi:hypothetical protein